MRKPSLSKSVREGLELLITNPRAAMEVCPIQSNYISKDELEKVRRAAEWIRQINEYTGTSVLLSR